MRSAYQHAREVWFGIHILRYVSNGNKYLEIGVSGGFIGRQDKWFIYAQL